jgi:transposase
VQDTQAQLEFYKQENQLLKQELAQLKRLIFGARSERFVPPDPAQGTLSLEEPQNGFQIPQAAVEPESITKPVKQKAKTEKQHLPVRGPIPAHIPRVKTEILPEEINLETAVRIGEDRIPQLRTWQDLR